MLFVHGCTNVPMFDMTAMRSMCEPHDAITCNMVEPVSCVWSCPLIQRHRASSRDSIDLSICTHTYHACNNYINTYAYVVHTIIHNVYMHAMYVRGKHYSYYIPQAQPNMAAVMYK